MTASPDRPPEPEPERRSAPPRSQRPDVRPAPEPDATDTTAPDETETTAPGETDAPAPGAPGRRPGRLRRAIAAAGAALGLSAVFAGAAAVGLVLHLDTPAARRVVEAATNELLGSIFHGKIVAQGIESLSLDEVRIRAALALDPEGGQVIRASGLHARADVLGILRDALLGEGELVIEIPYIRLEQADVLVHTNGRGSVTIGDTFTPLPPKTPSSAPKPQKAPPRPVRVALSHIEIGHGWVHGVVAPPRALDADVSRLAGSVHVGPEGVAVDVEQTGLVDRAFLPAKTAGTANYHLRAGKELRMWSSFAGHVADVGVTARGVMENGHVEASAGVPRVTPAQLATLLPGHPIAEPISAEIAVDGDLPALDVRASMTALPAGSAGGSFAVAGRIDAASPARFELDVGMREVDPALFGVKLGAPGETKVTAEGRVRIEAGDALRLAADARTEPVVLSGQGLPAMDVHVVLYDGLVSGTARLHEPGMPIDAGFEALPRGEGVRFAASSDIPAIAAAPRLAGPVDGSARVRAWGTVRGGELDARFDGAVGGLDVDGQAGLASGSVAGRVHGPVDALEVDATLKGRGARAGAYTFDGLEATARGKVSAPELRATLSDEKGSIKASGRLATSTGAVRGVAVRIEREGNQVEGRIASITPSRGGVAVEGIALEGEGVGALQGALAVRGGDVTGRLRGEGVDLGRVAQMLGVPHRVRGVANVEIALDKTKSGRSGKVLLELEEGEISVLSGVSAHLAATIDGDRVKADGLVRLVGRAPAGGAAAADGDACSGTLAGVRVTRGEGVLAGPLLRAETWENLSGSAEVAAEDWDLHCLSQLAPIQLVLSDVRGKLTTRFRVSRAPGERFPSLEDVTMRTRGLELAGPQGLGDEHPAWESRSIDAQVRGSLDGAAGKAQATLTLFDGELLGDVSASAELDLATLVDRPDRRWASLRAAPITGRIAIPRRALSSFRTLPAPVVRAFPPVVGDVRLEAAVQGSYDQPVVAVRAQGFGLAYAPPDEELASALSFPADVDALLTYGAGSATLDAHVSKGGHEIATIVADAKADLHAALASLGKADRPRWTGGFRARLVEVPIGELPLLGDSGIGGHVNGEITMTGLNEAPRLAVDVDVPDLQIGEDFFEEAALSLHVDPRKDAPGEGMAIAKATIVSQQGGRLDATAYAGVRFLEGFLPEIDGERAADLLASAKGFRLTALHPIVGSSLSKLDGYLDGDLRLGWRRVGEGDAGSVNADMRITKGVVHVPELGQELRDVSGHIIAKDGGVRLEQLTAAGTTGRARGWIIARLDGLKLRDGAGYLVIAKDEALPLTLEGVPLGNAWGQVSFTADKREDELSFDVTVTDLSLALPATSARNVQSLEENPEIAVSHRLGPEKKKRSEDALRYALKFDLGSVVVEGEGLKMHLVSAPNAPPRVVIRDEARVSGDILLARGEFEIFGKVFEIERGLVRLREQETSNPYLNVTAFWDAPDGTRIYVDYAGLLRPITADKLTFRSNPPSSKKEILARLLFGAEYMDGTLAGGSSQETSAGQAAGGVAVGVGGELAAAQLNTLLSGISPLRGLSTRFGTTSEGTLRTSVAYEIDDDLTALATIEGAPSSSRAGATTGTAATAPGGTANQRTERTELSVDWRFHRNWTLRGTVGVGGVQSESGAIDLLWQYRY